MKVRAYFVVQAASAPRPRIEGSVITAITEFDDQAAFTYIQASLDLLRKMVEEMFRSRMEGRELVRQALASKS